MPSIGKKNIIGDVFQIEYIFFHFGLGTHLVGFPTISLMIKGW